MLEATKVRTGQPGSHTPSTATIDLTPEQRLDQALRYILLMHDLRENVERAGHGLASSRA